MSRSARRTRTTPARRGRHDAGRIRRAAPGGRRGTSRSGASSWTSWPATAARAAGRIRPTAPSLARRLAALARRASPSCRGQPRRPGGRAVVRPRIGRRAGVHAEQRPDLGLAEPAVPAGGADAADPPGGGPAGDRLGVDPEECRHLAWCEQPLTSSLHGPPWSCRTSVLSVAEDSDKRRFYP